MTSSLETHLDHLTKVTVGPREKVQEQLGYDASVNYCGPQITWRGKKITLGYPRIFPYWTYLNWPSFLHDRAFDEEDRTTNSNFDMRDNFALELMLDGIKPNSYRFFVAMMYFDLVILPMISTVGRLIDK